MILILLVLLAATSASAEMKLEPIDGDRRSEYLERAQVWRPMDIENLDIAAGPNRRFSFNQEVRCTYVEKEKLEGAAPKFLCRLDSGEVVRIKYGKDNPEVLSEPITTRLFWALGFFTDEVYPVRIVCLKCPENPSDPGPLRKTVKFPVAALEIHFPGVAIETKEDEGWKWSELTKVDSKKGGASKAQLDALRLLAVFVQHSDNKNEQQRLACYQEDLIDPDRDGKGSCKRPLLMVQDVGATFGAGDQLSSPDTKMKFDAWKSKNIWHMQKEEDYVAQQKQRPCIGNLTNSNAAGEDGLFDPIISEEGRKFLADLLSRLSTKQINELFRIARAELTGHSIEDWAAVFLDKRKQILERNCELR